MDCSKILCVPDVLRLCLTSDARQRLERGALPDLALRRLQKEFDPAGKELAKSRVKF
jgi:hypothetical protein